MRGMALGKAGGRTRERDPNPESKRRADRARGEALLAFLESKWKKQFCRNSSEIQTFDAYSTFSNEFGEIPRNFHQNLSEIR